MKNLLKIFPLFFIGLISCQNEITEIPEPEIPSADLENFSGVERDIMINILSTKFGGYKKGCTPIAVSQYLYYTHYKDGVPSSTVTTATLTADGKDYVFSGNSSSIWDSMEKTWTYLPPKQTAIFIGYIGICLDADYGSDATEVYETKSPVYLQQVYGVQFPRVSFDYQYVKKSIDKGYPVVAGARTNKKEDGTSILNSGHAFLVDQYKQTTEIVKYVYGLIRDPWNPKDGEDPWDDNDYDDEGNIIGWAYTNEIEQTQSYSSISMNWGYLEHENNVFYYPYSQEWNAGGYIYII